MNNNNQPLTKQDIVEVLGEAIEQNILPGVAAIIQGETKKIVKDEVSTIKDEVSTIKDKVSTINDEVSTIKNEVSTIKDEVSTIKDEVSTLKDEVSTINDEVSTINDEVSTINDEVSTIKNEVSTLKDLYLGLDEKVDKFREEILEKTTQDKNEILTSNDNLVKKLIKHNDERAALGARVKRGEESMEKFNSTLKNHEQRINILESQPA